MSDPRLSTGDYDFAAYHDALRGHVDAEVIPGASTAVLLCRDLVDLHCMGWADREAQTPLRLDHIFRVFSNTKLVTSCAALLLFEQGRFQLDDPIERFIPQLANPRVLCSGAVDVNDTEPAIRPIAIRHLMSHSSGLSYGMFDPESVLFKAYADRGVNSTETSLAQMIDALEGLPLVFHPGTSWEYSVATDVLARLVEVISGQRFDEFIESKIFQPLGMEDTAFVVPEHNRERLVAYYAGVDQMAPLQPGLTRTDDAPYPRAYLRPVARLSGGGGLVSTLPDMISLVRSLLPGGPTLLQPETNKLMTSNQLPEGVWMRFPRAGVLPGKGYGLAGSVLVERSTLDPNSSIGELQWGGVAGTHWWIDPTSGIAGIMMMQRQMAFWHPCYFQFKRMVYDEMSRVRELP